MLRWSVRLHKWIALIVATVLVAGACIWIVSWEDTDEPEDVDACPNTFSNVQYFGTQSGNPELDPINAEVWSYGVVWAPTTAVKSSRTP